VPLFAEDVLNRTTPEQVAARDESIRVRKERLDNGIYGQSGPANGLRYRTDSVGWDDFANEYDYDNQLEEDQKILEEHYSFFNIQAMEHDGISEAAGTRRLFKPWLNQWKQGKAAQTAPPAQLERDGKGAIEFSVDAAQSFGKGFAQSYTRSIEGAGAIGRAVGGEDNRFFSGVQEAGKASTEFVEDFIGETDDTLSNDIFNGLGQFAGLIGGGFIAKGLVKGGTVLARKKIASQASKKVDSTALKLYDEAAAKVATDAAKRAAKSGLEKAATAIGIGAPAVGLTMSEFMTEYENTEHGKDNPITTGELQKLSAASFALAALDVIVPGRFMKAEYAKKLMKYIKPEDAGKIRDVLTTGGLEGGTEALQQIGINGVLNLVVEGEDRDLLEGALYEGGVGGAVGGIAELLLGVKGGGSKLLGDKPDKTDPDQFTPDDGDDGGGGFDGEFDAPDAPNDPDAGLTVNQRYLKYFDEENGPLVVNGTKKDRSELVNFINEEIERLTTNVSVPEIDSGINETDLSISSRGIIQSLIASRGLIDGSTKGNIEGLQREIGQLKKLKTKMDNTRLQEAIRRNSFVPDFKEADGNTLPSTVDNARYVEDKMSEFLVRLRKAKLPGDVKGPAIKEFALALRRLRKGDGVPESQRAQADETIKGFYRDLAVEEAQANATSPRNQPPPAGPTGGPTPAGPTPAGPTPAGPTGGPPPAGPAPAGPAPAGQGFDTELPPNLGGGPLPTTPPAAPAAPAAPPVPPSDLVPFDGNIYFQKLIDDEDASKLQQAGIIGKYRSARLDINQFTDEFVNYMMGEFQGREARRAEGTERNWGELAIVNSIQTGETKREYSFEDGEQLLDSVGALVSKYRNDTGLEAYKSDVQTPSPTPPLANDLTQDDALTPEQEAELLNNFDDNFDDAFERVFGTEPGTPPTAADPIATILPDFDPFGTNLPPLPTGLLDIDVQGTTEQIEIKSIPDQVKAKVAKNTTKGTPKKKKQAKDAAIVTAYDDPDTIPFEDLPGAAEALVEAGTEVINEVDVQPPAAQPPAAQPPAAQPRSPDDALDILNRLGGVERRVVPATPAAPVVTPATVAPAAPKVRANAKGVSRPNQGLVRKFKHLVIKEFGDLSTLEDTLVASLEKLKAGKTLSNREKTVLGGTGRIAKQVYGDGVDANESIVRVREMIAVAASDQAIATRKRRLAEENDAIVKADAEAALRDSPSTAPELPDPTANADSKKEASSKTYAVEITEDGEGYAILTPDFDPLVPHEITKEDIDNLELEAADRGRPQYVAIDAALKILEGVAVRSGRKRISNEEATAMGEKVLDNIRSGFSVENAIKTDLQRIGIGLSKIASASGESTPILNQETVYALEEFVRLNPTHSASDRIRKMLYVDENC